MGTIRVLTGVSGVDFSWYPGELVDLDDEEAAKWADGVRAELVEQTPAPDPKISAAAETGDPGADTGEGQDEGEGPELFEPADHNVKDVLAYLDGVGEQEATRVLQAEENAQAPRKGITGERDTVLARARANDQTVTETAAEASRGGGRGDGIETR